MATPLDEAWLTLCGILVFIMQAGFLCLEAGSTRSKNRINVVIKNFTDLGLSVIIFWAIGYGFMFGTSLYGSIGTDSFLPDLAQTSDVWTGSFFLFQAMFCSTAVTILSGAAAERIRFKVYLAITILISGLIYPMFGHWVWNGIDQGKTMGWLAQKGFVDFAGSTAVHSLGGWCALAAILVLGPRIGRFSQKRQFEENASADLPISFLGTMLLWFGWFGFNAGSNLVFDSNISTIIANTLMGGASGLVTPIIVMELRHQPVQSKPVLNGSLAGLVAVTSGCHAFSTTSALLVGGIGSLLMMLTSTFLEKQKIDDVVDAIPVHLISGIWGTLAVGLFGNLSQLNTGLDRLEQIKAQVAGVTTCGLWAFSITLLGLLILQYCIPLRVSARQEYVGLNISEHGVKSDIQDVYSVMKHHAKTGSLVRRIKTDPFTEVGQVGRWYNQVISALETAVANNNAIIHTAMDGIVTVDTGTLTLQSANPAMAEIFGYTPEQLIQKPFQHLFAHELSSQELSQQLRDIALAKSPQQLSGQHHNGDIFPIEVTATVAQIRSEELFTIFLQDISQRTQTQQALLTSRTEAIEKAKALENAMTQLKHTAQLIQRERLAGQHQLVSGIAHEINNPVNFIHGNLKHAAGYVSDLIFAFEQYRQRHNELSKPVRLHIDHELEDIDVDYIAVDFPKLLTSMRTGTERIKDIVKQLRTFSRHDEAELKKIDLHQNIDSTLAILEHRLQTTQHRAAITIQRQYGDLPKIECYASMLNRAILNLLENAIEALDRAEPDTDSPYITVHTRRHQKHVILAIANNGPPIPAEDQKRIFDPFFTTQAIGQGTGLGCTLSHQIVVEQHHGSLNCHSSPGCETCFVIELPIQQFAVQETTKSIESPELANMTNNELVLTFGNNLSAMSEV